MKKDLKPAVYICRKTHSAIIALDANRAYPPDSLLPEPCAFESSDTVEFLLHMKKVHNGGRRIPAPKLPKLKPEGYAPRQSKEFRPEGLEVGATISWRQLVPTGETYYDDDLARTRDVLEWVERTGQVWSLGDYPRSAWAVPFDEIPDEAEVAVLVREDPYVLPDQPAFRHERTWAPARQAA